MKTAHLAILAVLLLSAPAIAETQFPEFERQSKELAVPSLPEELSFKSDLLTDPPMQFVSKLTRDELVKTPAWEQGSEYPPLSPRKAQALALSMLDKITGPRSWAAPVIYMRAFDVTQGKSKDRDVRWIYVLNFRLLSPRANEGGSIDIVVLMNGKVIEPRRANLHGLRPPQKISPALVGRMHGVTMLEFQTDRALQEIRVVVNEQIAGSLRVPVDDNQTNLKLATVVSGQRKSVSVFIDTVNHSTEIIAAYPPLRDGRDASPKESIGPVKDVKLAESEWIEVYRLSATRYEGKDVVSFELKIEIR